MSSAVTESTDFRAAQVEQTTFSEAVSKTGKTGFENNRTKSADDHTMDMRRLFPRTHQNLFLIAGTLTLG